MFSFYLLVRIARATTGDSCLFLGTLLQRKKMFDAGTGDPFTAHACERRLSRNCLEGGREGFPWSFVVLGERTSRWVILESHVPKYGI